MKALSTQSNSTSTQPPVSSTIAGAVREVNETIRPIETLLRLVTIEGEKLTFAKGDGMSPSERALVIANRAEQARTFGSQARWAYHSAGQLPNGEHIQEEIKKRLETMLSRSALYQLTSEATTLIPLMLTEGIKAPLSVFKDAKAELIVNEKTGRLAPLSKQTQAGRKLIPLLKTGTVTQAAIRDIRKNGNGSNGKATKPKSGPRAKDGKGGGSFEELAAEVALSRLNEVTKYLDGAKPSGDKLGQFVNVVTDIARKLGFALAPAAK